MIIILNGMFGTHIEKLAKVISYALNDNSEKIFKFDENNILNISLTNTKDNYINNEDETIVEITQSEENINKEKSNEKNQIAKMLNTLELKAFFLNSYLADTGVMPYPDFFNNSDTMNYKGYNKFDFNPEKIVKEYKPDYLKDYVICGQIGKYFIDEIIKVAGKENVLVYNIIRNPSIAHTIHQNNFEDLKEKYYIYDLYNAILLKKLDYVTTIKYEDINDKLIINEEEIDFDYNLTSDEENLKQEKLEELTNLYKNIDIINYWKKEQVDLDKMLKLYKEYYKKDLPSLQKNIFNELNY